MTIVCFLALSVLVIVFSCIGAVRPLMYVLYTEKVK